MATFKIKKPDGSWEIIGSASVDVDATLTQTGMAADSKTVGEALAALQSDIPKEPSDIGISITSSITSDSTALVTSGAVYDALSNVDVDGFVPIDGGTMEGMLVADEISSASLAAVQVRNIVSIDSDPGAGTASAYPNGTVVLVRE